MVRNKCYVWYTRLYHESICSIGRILNFFHGLLLTLPGISSFAESSCFLQPQDVVAGGKPMSEICGCMFCFHLWSLFGDGLGFTVLGSPHWKDSSVLFETNMTIGNLSHSASGDFKMNPFRQKHPDWLKSNLWVPLPKGLVLELLLPIALPCITII